MTNSASAMTHSQPSIRLKQISRIISRQPEDVSTRVSSSCVSAVMILLIIFLAGVAMITVGGLVFTTCSSSWLPTWLLVEGTSLLVICSVVFCSDSQTIFLSMIARAFFILFVFINIWCCIGIFWASADEECGDRFGLGVKIAVAFLFILLVLIYWCFYSTQEDGEKKKKNTVNLV